MTEFTLRGKKTSIPTSVDELSQSQYKRLLGLSLLYIHGAISQEQLRTLWLSHLLGLSLPWTDYVDAIRQEVAGQQDVIAAFFSEDGTPRLETTRQMIPEYEGWKARGGDMLDGLGWGAFTECLDTLSILRQTDSPEEADQLYNAICKLLYTAPESGGEPPILLVVCAVNHLLAVWGAILAAPVNINGEDVPINIIFQGGDGHNDKTGWAGVTYEIATDGAFGTVEQVRNQSMWDVLLYLYKCKWESMKKT